MRFNFNSYDKLFPRQEEKEKPVETMVENYTTPTKDDEEVVVEDMIEEPTGEVEVEDGVS